MPVFDAEITVPVEVAYYIEGGQIIVDAVTVNGTGQMLPLNNKMAEFVLELCREDQKEG